MGSLLVGRPPSGGNSATKIDAEIVLRTYDSHLLESPLSLNSSFLALSTPTVLVASDMLCPIPQSNRMILVCCTVVLVEQEALPGLILRVWQILPIQPPRTTILLLDKKSPFIHRAGRKPLYRARPALFVCSAGLMTQLIGGGTNNGGDSLLEMGGHILLLCLESFWLRPSPLATCVKTPFYLRT